MRLTHDSMMSHWRSARGLDPERSDSSVEVFEGAGVTGRLATEMRQWYLHLLDTAPLRYLVLTDIASRLQLCSEGGPFWKYTLPREPRRVTELTLKGPGRPVTVTDGADGTWAGIPGNPYVRGNSLGPRAYRSGDTLTIVSDIQPVPLSVMAVLDSGDEEYVFDESALSLIPGRISEGPLDPLQNF